MYYQKIVLNLLLNNSKIFVVMKMRIKLLIAGSRGYTDYGEACRYINKCLESVSDSDIIVISGGARGADILGERYAAENGYKIEKHLPDWKRYGRSAGIIRNREMVIEADLVICFWDGESRGTRSTIEFSKRLGKKLRVIKV